jgi:MFS family permease
MKLRSLRAFRHRNFRLFFCGQSTSLIGTWIQLIAMSWLVYRLTGSAWLLGVTGFAMQIPILLLAPFAGTLADRFDRRRLLVGVQVAMFVQAVTLAVLDWSGAIQVWHVIVLALLGGIINAADTPLRQSLMPELVTGREDLAAAVAFSSFMQNAGRLIGPTLAGVLLAFWSEAVCFALNAVSKLAVIGAVVALALAPRPPRRGGSSVLDDIREGVAYAWNLVPIRILLPVLACVSFMATPYQTLMPIVAAEVFGGGADTLGFLIGAAGFGGTSTVLWLAGRRSVRGLPRIIAGGAATAGIALVAFAFCPWYFPALALLFIAGGGIMTVITSTSQILQTIVDDDKRGRVMSIYTMSFLGMIPLGALAAGAAAELIGALYTMAAGGAFCLVAAAILVTRFPTLRTHLTPIYERLGVDRN